MGAGRSLAMSTAASSQPFGTGWIKEEERAGGVFGQYADEYDQLRPHYPASLWDLAIKHVQMRTDTEPCSWTAADIGCGTGRGVADLYRQGWSRIYACEPDPGMLGATRSKLEARIAEHPSASGTDVEYRQCTAEQTGLPAHSCDLVTCLQAWHWVDLVPGLEEMRRILKPGGVLALAWNDRDLTDPLVAAMEETMEAYNPHYQRDARQCDAWGERLVTHNIFTLELQADLPNQLGLANADQVLELLMTFSYVRNALTSTQQDAFLTDMRTRLDAFTFPYSLPLLTRLYLLRPTMPS
ncbi:uncharacterized protein MONBRDRAFT_6966 [Monosiga brevicollis MX1]|uniref:Methyltransferase type 11 domain-containing protein n=1 Tax=Monosiga brevicollis TaxID=81824 RepID=A9UVH5_MONBE|nr:uncharacterized protein MONBRDRAFT_6966 [Monosiga brevicollis MX1]EDQ90401.1 predicted protein [Monosiga brevicollis MX1]|eukprot:XP_001744452.1 hypothetical protein [Monosiga brevicollis MX1]